MTSPEPEVLPREQGALGRITLNRPKALNSLTLTMIRAITEQLRRWADAEHIRAVLIEGAGDRGLCAGGDIRAIHDAVKAGDESLSVAFWAEEYQLNAMLPHYPKPIVGLMDGICMGGGVGVSAHGSHRVVTERSKVGMPETGIGFAPDVGGTYLLSRAPGQTGAYLGLTGAPVGGADAIHCGLADYFVPSDRLEALVEELANGDVDTVLREFDCSAEQEPATFAPGEREWIDAAFAADDVEGVLERLRARREEAAHKAAELIETKSPTSLKVTLRGVRSGADSLEQALDREFRVALSCVEIGDFLEGVRATLVDKDRDPKWSPKHLSEVDQERVERFFAPRPGRELGLSG